MIKPHVSVIVPVYNAEKTLYRCLESLQNQTLKEAEFICVDDGSTDSSLSICKEYATRDNRFKVYHKHNEGVSATRQFGLDHANGEYVIHLDADDYVDPSIYETMYHRAKEDNADIVTCDAYRITDSGKEYMGFSISRPTTETVLKDLLNSFGSVWNRLLKKEIIVQTHTRFPENISYGEDKIFLTSLLKTCYNESIPLTFTYISLPLLYYDTVANGQSLTKLPADLWLRRRMTMFDLMSRELNMRVFGKVFFTLIFEQAYDCVRPNSPYLITRREYASLFNVYKKGISHYIPLSAKKIIVRKALRNGAESAKKLYWTLIPTIIYEKIRNSVL